MDNKQIFTIAGNINKMLHATKLLTGHPRDTKQTIYDAIRPYLQQAVKAGTQGEEKKGTEEEEKEKEFQLARRLATDPEYARGWLTQQLATSVTTGNAQAAKEIRDILQIASNKDGLTVATTSFQDVPTHCPACGENIHKPAELLPE